MRCFLAARFPNIMFSRTDGKMLVLRRDKTAPDLGMGYSATEADEQAFLYELRDDV